MSNIFVTFIIIFIYSSTLFGEAQKSVTILFTNNTLAELSPCGCAAGQTGGFPRRMTVINDERKVNPSLILVDSGDTLFETSVITAGFKDELREKAKLISEIYKKMRVDVMTPGELDLALGVSFLKKLNLPYVSVNIMEQGKTAFNPYTIVKRDKLKIAFFGVSDPKAFSKSDISIADPAESLNKSIKSFAESVDLKILLSHGGILFDQELAKKISGIDFIISSHDGMRTEDPVVSDEVTILEADRMGKYIGKLSINLGGSVQTNLNETLKAKKELWWQEEELRSYVKKAGFKDNYKSDDLLEFYKGDPDSLSAIKRHIQKIDEVKKNLSGLLPLTTSGFTCEFFLLSEEQEEDISIKKMIDAFKKRFNTV